MARLLCTFVVFSGLASAAVSNGYSVMEEGSQSTKKGTASSRMLSNLLLAFTPHTLTSRKAGFFDSDRKNRKGDEGTAHRTQSASGVRMQQYSAKPPRTILREGDWICPRNDCQDIQFRRNTVCRRCGEKKPGGTEADWSGHKVKEELVFSKQVGIKWLLGKGGQYLKELRNEYGKYGTGFRLEIDDENNSCTIEIAAMNDEELERAKAAVEEYANRAKLTSSGKPKSRPRAKSMSDADDARSSRYDYYYGPGKRE